MDNPTKLEEPELERQSRRLGHSGVWFVAVGAIFALPGIVLVVFAHSWAMAVGIAVLAIAAGPMVVGVGLLLSSLVARWSARHNSFA